MSNVNLNQIQTNSNIVKGESKSEEFKNLINKLKETESSDEVIQILGPGLINPGINLDPETFKMLQNLNENSLSQAKVEILNSNAPIILNDLKIIQKLELENLQNEVEEELELVKKDKMLELNDKPKVLDKTSEIVEKLNLEKPNLEKQIIKPQEQILKQEELGIYQTTKEISQSELVFKVGDGETISPQKFVQELNQKVLIDIKEGTKEYEIQLDPVNLGKIKIKMAQDGLKTVVSIICSEQKTAALLNLNIKDIHKILGQTNNDVVVTVKEDAQPSEKQFDQSNGSNKRQYQGQKHNQDSREFANRMRVKLEDISIGE